MEEVIPNRRDFPGLPLYILAGLGFVAVTACCYVLILLVSTLISIRSISAAGQPEDEGRIVFVKNLLAGYEIPLDSSLFEGIEGDPGFYEWYGPFTTAAGPNPEVILPEGTHAVSLYTNDGRFRTGPYTCYITVKPAFSISLHAKLKKVVITWPKRDNTQKYKIYRTDASNPENFKKIAELQPAVLNYTDTSVTDTTYLYIVAALSDGQWFYSQVRCAHPYSWIPKWNYQPVIYSNPVTHALAGLPYTYNTLATDVKGDTLTYTLDNPPAGMKIDTQTGLIEWLPASAGDFDVVVKVKNRKGASSFQKYIIEVDKFTNPDEYQIAQAGGPYSGEEGEDIAFDGSASHDPEGSRLAYKWDFGDGTHDDGILPVHTYKSAGKYQVSLTVTDARGRVSSDVTKVTVQKCFMPKVNLSMNPAAVMPGEPCSLIWSSKKSSATCIDHGVGPVGASGSIMVYPETTTRFIITADNSCGTATSTATVIVHRPPTVEINVSADAIGKGGVSTLSWSSSNADTVIIYPDIGTVMPTGSLDVSPAASTSYTITATGPGGTAKDTVAVRVNQATAISINASPRSIMSGQSSKLSWTSFNTDRVAIDQGIGSVVSNGSLIVMPAETTIYTIMAEGPNGPATESVTITVQAKPEVNISAEPSIIFDEEAATITWSSRNADSLVIDNNIGNVDTKGSLRVSPTETTTYTITAQGQGVTTSARAMVTVLHKPSVRITASPGDSKEGGEVTLTWSSKNARSATIDQGIGPVGLKGYLQVTPAHTTTYTITVTDNNSMSASARVTVNVNHDSTKDTTTDLPDTRDRPPP